MLQYGLIFAVLASVKSQTDNTTSLIISHPGLSVTMQCGVISTYSIGNSSTAHDVRWTKDGKALNRSPGLYSDTSPSKPSLKIDHVTVDVEGIYMCTVAGPLGTVHGHNVTLIVFDCGVTDDCEKACPRCFSAQLCNVSTLKCERCLHGYRVPFCLRILSNKTEAKSALVDRYTSILFGVCSPGIVTIVFFTAVLIRYCSCKGSDDETNKQTFNSIGEPESERKSESTSAGPAANEQTTTHNVIFKDNHNPMQSQVDSTSGNSRSATPESTPRNNQQKKSVEQVQNDERAKRNQSEKKGDKPHDTNTRTPPSSDDTEETSIFKRFLDIQMLSSSPSKQQDQHNADGPLDCIPTTSQTDISPRNQQSPQPNSFVAAAEDAESLASRSRSSSHTEQLLSNTWPTLPGLHVTKDYESDVE